MTVGGKEYTDRKEAGTALIAMCKELKGINASADVGEYLGFKMNVTFDSFNNKFVLNMKGAMSHPLEVGADPSGKYFKGPIWKQYHTIVNYINDNILNTLTLREEGESVNRKVSNFPYVAVEELVANAIVHNNYENGKPIQVYISENQINIVNYNKPLPPLKLQDLNERTFFSERDTENPEIRDMFKALGIIESFGTGIGEAKRALANNGSPELFYKVFDTTDNVTSVVIPVSEEYKAIKKEAKPNKKLGIEYQTQDVKQKILGSDYSRTTKQNLIKIYDKIGTEVFGNSRIVEILNCSETTATNYINRMYDELKITVMVEGVGKGKYKFIV